MTKELRIAHSWEGYLGHLTRPDKKIKRCMIGKLDIKDDQIVGISVEFQEKGIKKKKLVSPLLLATMEFLWWDNAICSDSDEDDEKNEFLIHPPTKKLPLWDIPDLKLLVNPTKFDAMKWHMEQVNQLISLIS